MNYVIDKKIKRLSIFHIHLSTEGCTRKFIELSSFCQELSWLEVIKGLTIKKTKKLKLLSQKLIVFPEINKIS